MDAGYERWLRRSRVLTTAEEWDACPLLDPVIRPFRHRTIGARTALLLAAAFLRRQWDWPEVEKCRGAVEAVERWAEGDLPAEEVLPTATALREARLAITAVMGGQWWQMSHDYSEEGVADTRKILWSTSSAIVGMLTVRRTLPRL